MSMLVMDQMEPPASQRVPWAGTMGPMAYKLEAPPCFPSAQ